MPPQVRTADAVVLAPPPAVVLPSGVDVTAAPPGTANRPTLGRCGGFRLLRERRSSPEGPPEACAERLVVSTGLVCLLLLDGVELTAEVVEVPASVSTCGGVGRGDATFPGPSGQRRCVHAQLTRGGGSGQKALRHGADSCTSRPPCVVCSSLRRVRIARFARLLLCSLCSFSSI